MHDVPETPQTFDLVPGAGGEAQLPADRLVIRRQIADLEATMLELPQVEIPVTHTFNGDLYVRSIVIPAGTTATGKVHRHPTTHLVLKGRMTILTEGGGRREVVDGAIFVSPPGNKMCGVAHEDTIWATAHITKLRDVAAIERELCFSAEELPAYYAAQLRGEEQK